MTKFLSEHPGGEQALLDLAGQDATSSFHDVGHSSDAWKMAEEYVVGQLKTSEEEGVKEKTRSPECCLGQCFLGQWREIVISPTWSNFLIPLGISLLVYFSYKGVKELF